MLPEEDDHLHPPWVQRLRRKARRMLVAENTRIAYFEERERCWRFADNYDPDTFFPEQHEDLSAMQIHRLGEIDEYQSPEPDLPRGLEPATVAAAVEHALQPADHPGLIDHAVIPAGKTFQRLRAEARSRAGWKLPADEDEPGATPRRATIERQAMIYSLFHDPFEQALLSDITPLDILEAVSRRFLANGNLWHAAQIAAIAAPYLHPVARPPREAAIERG